MKRLLDIIISLFALVILLPVFVVVGFAIVIDSRGGVFFSQIRVGLNGKEFSILKFRSMKPNTEGQGQITTGSSDMRITGVGQFIRKYKIDELPQLWNVIVGNMSLVGPRPEVPRYVKMYSERQLEVLSVKPGITDYASLEYFEEGELLAASADPEKTYVEEIMPKKLELNLRYIQEKGFKTDFSILLKTAARIFE